MGKLKLFQALLSKKYHEWEANGKDMSNIIFFPTFREKIKKAPDPDMIIKELDIKQLELEEKYKSYRDLLKVSEDSIPMFVQNQNQAYISEKKRNLIKAKSDHDNAQMIESTSIYNEMEGLFKVSPESKLVKDDQSEFFQIIAEHKLKVKENNNKESLFNGIFEEKMVTDPILMGNTYLKYEQLSLLLFTLAQSIKRGEHVITNEIADMLIRHNSRTYYRYIFRLVWCKMNNIKINC